MPALPIAYLFFLVGVSVLCSETSPGLFEPLLEGSLEGNCGRNIEMFNPTIMTKSSQKLTSQGYHKTMFTPDTVKKIISPDMVQKRFDPDIFQKLTSCRKVTKLYNYEVTQTFYNPEVVNKL